MMLLHSVWSGGGSSAARRKVLAALALLALLAGLLVWAAPGSQAQANQAPFANAGPDQTLNAGGSVTLDGSQSIDVDDGDDTGVCQGCEYEWEIETGPYDWIGIGENDTTPEDNATSPGAYFEMPSQAFVDKVADSDPQKYVIVVRLTVTDNDGATATDTVSININQRPVADIQVFAGLRDDAVLDPDASTKERYSTPAVIDGPGENGNRDNEWDVMEGAYLQLDGSGSTDENPSTGRPAAYTWSRVQIVPSAATGTNEASGGLAGPQLVVGTVAETTDLNSDGDVADAGESVNVLPDVQPNAPVTVFYQLTVCDVAAENCDGGLTGASLIRIVVHDTLSAPEVEIDAKQTEASRARNGAGADPQDTVGQFTGVDNQFIVAAGTTVLLTAAVADEDQKVLDTARDDDGTTHSGHVYRWSGAAQRDDVSTTVNVDERNSATVRVPAGAEDGDTIDVSVTVVDATRISVTTEIQLLVGENTPPTAGGVPADQGSIDNADPDSDSFGAAVLFVHSIPDGFQNQNQRDGSTVTLRGVGNDADGDSIITAWALREAPDPDAFNTAVETWVAADKSDAADKAAADGAALVGVGAPLRDLREPEDPLFELRGALTDTVSFDVPNLENGENKGAILIFTVIDSNGASASQLIYIHIRAEDDLPNADAGPDQQVDPGAFVRLNGSASSDPDVGDRVSHSWEYVGATMDPAPHERPPLSDDEIDELKGWILRKATADEITADAARANNMKRTFKNSDGDSFVYIVDSDGKLLESESSTNLKSTSSPYPYFDAPDLSGFNNLKLTFTLTVTDSTDDPRDDDDDDGVGDSTTDTDGEVPESDSDSVTVTVVNRFFSGNIPGPDFCIGKSLGGPQTYPFDSDDDGVADTCSLNTTRRATVARQNALETLAGLNPDEFRTAVLAVCNAPGFKQASYGDDPADLDGDVCATERVSPPPAGADPATAQVFFSGAITGPDFCANHSLGGARTYAHDSDGDGVADQCSLATTRREAIARQQALGTLVAGFSAAEQTRHDELAELLDLRGEESLGDVQTARLTALNEKHASEFDETGGTDGTVDDGAEATAVQAEVDRLATKKADAARYSNALAAACRALGSQDFGDAPSALARDACAPKSGPTGQPLS